MHGRASPAPRSHGLHLLWGSLSRLEFAKSLGKCVFLVYAPSLKALFAILSSTACILHDIFTLSQCFRHHFDEKWTLLSEFTSHTYGRLTLPARYVVFACRHDVVLLESPTLNCMLYFAALNCLADQKSKGGGVALPGGPSIVSLAGCFFSCGKWSQNDPAVTPKWFQIDPK